MLGIRRLTYHFDVHKSLFCPTTYIVQYKDSAKYSFPYSTSIQQRTRGTFHKTADQAKWKVHEILRDRNAYYFMLQPNIYQNYFFKIPD